MNVKTWLQFSQFAVEYQPFLPNPYHTPLPSSQQLARQPLGKETTPADPADQCQLLSTRACPNCIRCLLARAQSNLPQIIPEKIKIAAAGDLTTAVNRVNSYAPNIPVEVEVTDLDKLSKLARPSPPGDEPHMRQVKQIGTAISARG